ncbi:MAG: hypothetical protein COA73_00115 [Candidatus Hydrogenedentota bacterium]|nr:MAG: hypothetical protein COA73_00115 [Candidatus Hydrogenedentota bacterium]
MDDSVKTSSSVLGEGIEELNTISGTIGFKLTSVVNQLLPSRVELINMASKKRIVKEFPTGVGHWVVPVGDYTAHISAYDVTLPIVISIQSISVQEDNVVELKAEVLEGVVGDRTLRAFDQDFDQVLDRVESEAGTDPFDASSTPGDVRLSWNNPVLSDNARWYRGDFHAYSNYGEGDESVAKLVRRAEQANLDFLAITDRHSIRASLDDDFKSDSVVLIPGLEWGSKETGVALLLAPKTMPRMPTSYEEAQRMVIRVQAQGGIFVLANPCDPSSPWNWGLDYFNAVEVWTGKWRQLPPITMDDIDEGNKTRTKGQLNKSIAVAAATALMSGNGQSALFYDLELSRGSKAGVVAGSRSGGPSVPLGEPVTYVYAREKSLLGILEGLRLGRTYVSSGIDGPQIEWIADIMSNGSFDVSIGGTIPVDVVTRFTVNIRRAKGKRFDLLMNGHPAVSTIIKDDNWNFSFNQKPDTFAVYRCRITEVPLDSGYGLVNVLAMTSPIYAQGILMNETESGVDAWMRIENEQVNAGDAEAFMKYLESQGAG